MLQSRTRWHQPEVDERLAEQLKNELNVSVISARLLAARGFESAEKVRQMIHNDWSIVHNPYLLDGMEKAVRRIQQAVENKERILVFGDYDADGVSSTTIMIRLLTELGASFGWYIPNRFTEGYGPNVPAFQSAHDEGASLIITVDTGIAAVNEIQTANDLGMDVIITDHHEPPPELPPAYAIINPKKPGCTYPFKELAGVGVAYKLAHALLTEEPVHWLDIVTLGTISDLVPLVEENRLFVQRGLDLLTNSKLPGVQALKRICSIEGEQLEEDHVGFAMGPRLNAAGRMEEADPAVHLLTAATLDEAESWAEMIDDLNNERKTLVESMTKEAVEEVETNFPVEDNPFIIVAGKGWNAGVIGIVASRLVERYYRPVIVMSIDAASGEAKGSARSIEGFDMFQELSKNRDVLQKFGGHPMAAGMSLDPADIDTLRTRMVGQAKETLSSELMVPATHIDVHVSVNDITIEAVEDLRNLAPFGVGNPKPVFRIEKTVLESVKTIGASKNHLKMALAAGGKKLDCVGFHLGYLSKSLTENEEVSVVGELSINEWNGFRKPQLFLRDAKVEQIQVFDRRKEKQVTFADNTDTAVLAFTEEQQKELAASAGHAAILNGTDIKGRLHHASNVVIADMPASLDMLKQALAEFPQAANVYVYFHGREKAYFHSMPSREQFKWYYAFLKKRSSFDLNSQGRKLAEHKQWKTEDLFFMSQVFFELGFVKMEDAVVTAEEKPAKKDLTDSSSYQEKMEARNVEQELMFTPFPQLKKRILSWLPEKDETILDVRKKVNHGL